MTVGAECGPYPLLSAITSPDNGRLAIEWGGACERRGAWVGHLRHEYRQRNRPDRAREMGHIIGFSPDGKTLGGGGSEFAIYDSKNGKKIRTLQLLDAVGFKYDWNVR